jgi:hypothetical protein
MQLNHIRAATRFLHNMHNTLRHVPAWSLPTIAKHLARDFSFPQKAMLKAMRRYIRIHHTI